MDLVRLGVIGYGLRGSLAREFAKNTQRCKITAFCELRDDRIEKFKEDNGIDCFITKDYKEVINHSEVDAVLILTEDYKHVDHAIESLEAGKDVYLEKPMAISIEDCDRILRTWKQTGKKLMIGFNMRYMPMYETMKKYIDEGVIGEIKAVWVRHFVGFGGYFYYQDWHRNSKFTNSLLLQKASHDIDVIHMLCDSYVKKVSALGSLDFYDDPEKFEADGLKNIDDCEINVEDNNVVIMELENGVKASYLQNHFTPEYSRNYTIIGTKGRIENDDVNDTITIKSRNTSSLEDKSDIVIHMKPQDGFHAGGDQRIVDGFLDYVLSGIEPKASPIDGRMSVAVGCKATDSLRSGGHLQEIPEIKW